jgi:hypothetical protein
MINAMACFCRGKLPVKKVRIREGFNRSKHSMNPDRPKEGLKGVAKPRDKSTIKRLQMYRNFKPKRNPRGKIIRDAPFQGWLPSGTMARYKFCKHKGSLNRLNY